jgi:hypothetical protein
MSLEEQSAPLGWDFQGMNKRMAEVFVSDYRLPPPSSEDEYTERVGRMMNRIDVKKTIAGCIDSARTKGTTHVNLQLDDNMLTIRFEPPRFVPISDSNAAEKCRKIEVNCFEGATGRYVTSQLDITSADCSELAEQLLTELEESIEDAASNPCDFG